MESSATYKALAEVATGVLPTAAQLGKKTQESYYTGASGEELLKYSQEYTGAKASETVKTTTLYGYNADDSMRSSVTYKDATVRAPPADDPATAAVNDRTA